jgi:hypothetical protein
MVIVQSHNLRVRWSTEGPLSAVGARTELMTGLLNLAIRRAYAGGFAGGYRGFLAAGTSSGGTARAGGLPGQR